MRKIFIAVTLSFNHETIFLPEDKILCVRDVTTMDDKNPKTGYNKETTGAAIILEGHDHPLFVDNAKEAFRIGLLIKDISLT